MNSISVSTKSLSVLLEELARAPEVDLHAWMSPKVGSTVGRFDLIRELGRGGFGVVFEARDRELGRLVALKAIKQGNRSVVEFRQQQLRQEAEAAARLSHPNIVTLFDFGTSEYGPYLILELLHGETLQEKLVRGPLAPREAVGVAIEVARAMAYSHVCGVLHRDLKPSNVFLVNDGTVKVLDFGLAHIFGKGAANRSGTLSYMAPEQRRGEPEDARVDVFSLGVMLFEMLTTRLPYQVSVNGRVALENSEDPLPLLPSLPLSLKTLITKALSHDPNERPRDGGAMLADLEEVDRVYEAQESEKSSGAKITGRRSGVSNRMRWVTAGLVVLVLALGWHLLITRSTGSERVRVVVADFANETGDGDLDGLSGLLITSLEQSRHLAVITRSRVLDILGQSGETGLAHIDEALGRQAGRQVNAKVLLRATIRRFGEKYSIDLKAVEPVTDEYLFGLKEDGEGKSSIPEMIDRLSERTRRELREREVDVRASEVKVAEAVTNSLEAYQHYLASQQCMNRTDFGFDCAQELKKALFIDPTFALAHYQLAVWMSERGASWAKQREAIDAAERYSDRVPPRDRALIRAWKLHFDGKDDEALAFYQRMTVAYPSEQQPFYEAGDLLHHRSEYEAAAPFFEKLLALEPSHGWALDHWIEELGALHRTDQLRALVERWTAEPQSPALLHALCAARSWLGDYAGAARAAQLEAKAGGGFGALQDLFYVSVYAGTFEESRVELEKLASPGSPVRLFGYYALAGADAYQGRRRSGLNRFAALVRDLGTDSADAFFHSLRLDYLLGGGDAHAVWEEARQIAMLDPTTAAIHAVSLAYLGDLDHAAELAVHLRAGTPRQRTYQALVQWHRGKHATALEQLREIASLAPFDADRGLAPAYLFGELAATAGADAVAVEALRDFQSLYIPTAMWRSWAYPRSLYLMAVALERLGRSGDALHQVEKLLALWNNSDPELALMKDAQALRARLVTAGQLHVGIGLKR